MATDKKNKTTKNPPVDVRDMKPSADAKGGAVRKQDASFILKDGVDQDAQKKEIDEL